MYGEESLSIERRGDLCFKVYRDRDVTGRWQSPADWAEQLRLRAEASRGEWSVEINPVIEWHPATWTAVSAWLETARPTSVDDLEAVRLFAPKWLGGLSVGNILIVRRDAVEVPVVIDFHVRAIYHSLVHSNVKPDRP